MNLKLKNKKGYTLIELIISISIMLILSVGVFLLFSKVQKDIKTKETVDIIKEIYQVAVEYNELDVMNNGGSEPADFNMRSISLLLNDKMQKQISDDYRIKTPIGSIHTQNSIWLKADGGVGSFYSIMPSDSETMRGLNKINCAQMVMELNSIGVNTFFDYGTMSIGMSNSEIIEACKVNNAIEGFSLVLLSDM